MKPKTLLAGVLAGLAFFLWGFVFWAALPFPRTILKAAPGGAEAVAQMQAAGAPAGAYVYPSWEEMEKPESKGKPIITLLIYGPQGPGSMGLSIGRGLGISVLLGLLLATFASCAAPRSRGFGGRVMFAVMLGMIYCLAGPLVDWNWFSWPGNYLVFRLIDILGGFLAMGLVIGAMVAPCNHPACAPASGA